jgi:hypothetical protein
MFSYVAGAIVFVMIVAYGLTRLSGRSRLSLVGLAFLGGVLAMDLVSYLQSRAGTQ